MSELLIRDVMRIGVLTCKEDDPIPVVAAHMLEQNGTAIVVLDEDGDTAGWIGERHLMLAYAQVAALETGEMPTAGRVMSEQVPECPADLPLSTAAQIMVDLDVDHLFILHRAGGRAWPASLISRRDIVRALAGPDFIRDQGAGAPRPTPMDLFRQRYGRPNQPAS